MLVHIGIGIICDLRGEIMTLAFAKLVRAARKLPQYGTGNSNLDKIPA